MLFDKQIISITALDALVLVKRKTESAKTAHATAYTMVQANAD